MIIPLRAETYSDQLQDGLKLSYRHWNSEREEFTGYTHQEFLRVFIKEGRRRSKHKSISNPTERKPGVNPSGMNILPVNQSNTWKRI